MKKKMSNNLIVHDPIRSPSWRWQYAEELVKASNGEDSLSDIFLLSEPDHYVRRAAEFIDSYFSDDPISRLNALKNNQDIFLAYRLYQHPESHFRALFEARILAGESDEEISKKTGADPDAIAAYHALFFDVRDRLDKIDFIVQHIIGPVVNDGIQEKNFEAIWKLFGYMAGPKVLDVLVYRFNPNVLQPESYEEVANFFKSDYNFTIQLKAALAARTIPANRYHAAEILHHYAKLMEGEQGSSISSENNILISAVQSIVENLELEVEEASGQPKEQPLAITDSRIKGDEADEQPSFP